MRPLEALLVLINLLTFFVLAVRLPRAARWTRYSALIGLLAAGAQVLVEGLRWQMLPTYALSVAFVLAWLLQGGKPASEVTARSGASRLAARLGAGLGALGLAAATILPILFPVFRFPHPNGQYEIGTLTYDWVDPGRPEIFTADEGDRRELVVQVWYPARGKLFSKHSPYVQQAASVAPALARLFRLPEFTFSHLKYITTNAIQAAPVADDEAPYPVLIFSHGRGGIRQQNTFQVEELVSRGYIVAAIDHPYDASLVVFPDGHQAAFDERMLDRSFLDGIFTYLAQDAIFTLDQLTILNQADPNGILTGRLDLQRLGIFGHSLGGIVSAEACRLEPRLRACLALDVFMPADVVQAGLQQPVMWISRDAMTMQLEGVTQAVIEEQQTSMRAVFESLPQDGYLVLVPGMFHYNLTDIPFWSPLTSRLGLTGPIEARRAHRIIKAYTQAFFDRHLKGWPATLLDGPAVQYPEVIFEKRRP